MINYKHIFIFFLISLYILVGGYLSLTNGITSDESFEQLNWIENIKGVKVLLIKWYYDDFKLSRQISWYCFSLYSPAIQQYYISLYQS